MLVSHEKGAEADNDRRTKEGLGEMPRLPGALPHSGLWVLPA